MIKCKAYAKINLFLDIPGKLENGYHEIDTYMQSVSLFDIVTVESCDSTDIVLGCSDKKIPSDKTNIAYKAAELFYKHSGIIGGCKIFIEKHIPSEAGLGGGSADGACVLNALNEIYGKPINEKELSYLSKNVGADLPFCVLGGLRKCAGLGEIVGENISAPMRYFVIAKCTDGISTKDAFAQIDGQNNKTEKTSDEFISRYVKTPADYRSICFNRFEGVLSILCPSCGDIIGELNDKFGNCTLSGSGSAFFSVFDNEKDAQYAEKYIKDNYENAFVGLFTSKNIGFEIIERGN